MRLILKLCAIVMATSCVAASGSSATYWLLVNNDGRTWCGYQNETDFSPIAEEIEPTSSARVTYVSDKLTELTYQETAESGDWIVIDKYTPSKNDVQLRRAILLAQRQLEIIQETVIRGEVVGPFRMVSVSTLDGKESKASDVDIPDVPVSKNLLRLPFMRVVAHMRERSVAKLCEELD